MNSFCLTLEVLIHKYDLVAFVCYLQSVLGEVMHTILHKKVTKIGLLGNTIKLYNALRYFCAPFCHLGWA